MFHLRNIIPDLFGRPVVEFKSCRSVPVAPTDGETFEDFETEGEYEVFVNSIGITRLHKDAKLPTYATDGAVGADLCALFRDEEFKDLQPGGWMLVPTGLRIHLPPLTEAQIRPRSGLAFKHGITVLNAPGTIDSDYQGEIGVLLINHGNKSFRINNGDRIAQMVIAMVERGFFYDHNGHEEETERGAGGFGSTGIA